MYPIVLYRLTSWPHAEIHLMPDCSGDREKLREYIKYQLRLRGTSLAVLGRELGVSTATVSQVCAGSRTSERITAAIERRLQVPIADLHREDGS